jgi:superoxide reductase
MTEKLQIFRCEVCGNMVEVTHEGGGILVCCNRPMVLLTENTTDAEHEKHVPVVEKTVDGYKVTVASDFHPMTEEHFIEWVQLVADGNTLTHYFVPGEKPEAFFNVKAENLYARTYCNLHDLWTSRLLNPIAQP